jgi:hypothetical protein
MESGINSEIPTPMKIFLFRRSFYVKMVMVSDRLKQVHQYLTDALYFVMWRQKLIQVRFLMLMFRAQTLHLSFDQCCTHFVHYDS